LKQLSNKELKVLSDKIASNIQRVLGHFGVPIQDFGEYISCACPIHDGDNPNAFTMTVDSEHSYFGIWKCWTQGCEEDNINTPIGLIRALLSKFQDKQITFNEAVDFSMKLVETDFEDLVIKNHCVELKVTSEKESKTTNPALTEALQEKGYLVPQNIILIEDTQNLY
jgi:hypothetical protein